MYSRNPWGRSALSLVVAALATPLLSFPASAQNFMLEEVIVTARKRVETLQETPVAVTALDADALREAGIRNLADLNQIAPNIEVASANGNAPLANIFIRGVGARNTGVNVDSGVGIYIDGVYVGRPDGALLDIVDIQSVQVLRGPQGTLFGKNTTGGALVFTTNKPVEEFEGSLGARVGNFDRLDGDFVLNVPLTDKLYTRFSGAYRSRDGFIDNEFDGDKYMDEDRKSVIWQTRWLADDDFVLDLNANWSKTDQLGRPQKCVPVPGIDGWQAQIFDTLGVVPATGKTYDDFCQEAADAGDDLTVLSDLKADYESKNYGASLTAEWDFNDQLAIKSITAWRATEAIQNDDLDHTATPFLHRTMSVHPIYDNSRDTDQYSQEFQFTGSAFNDQLQYVSGLFWYREETDGGNNPSYVGPYDPAVANLFLQNSSDTQLEADNQAFAVFSQLEWEFNEHWRATAGVRYTDEERKLTRTRQGIDPASLDQNGGPVTSLSGGLYIVQRPDFVYNPAWTYQFTDYTQSQISDDDFTPMASLQYLIDEAGWIDTGTVYLTYSEGFLSGGLSEAPTGDLEQYDPEEVENWELGFKLDMMDRRLRVNGAFFYTDYTNRQLTTVVINPNTGNPSGATINAKSSSITGFELETTFLATERLMLTFNMTLNDGDIDEYEDVKLTLATDPSVPAGCSREDLSIVAVDICDNDRSNENLPRLPEETYLLAAQYNWDSSLGMIIPRIQASLKKDIDFCFDSTSCELGWWLEDEQFDLSATLTWTSLNEKWVGSLYGSNLTDEDHLVGGTALIESSGVGGYAVAPPRMYGAELQYRF